MARTITRVKLMFRLLRIFGDILMLVKCHKQACEVFEMMRCMANEMKETDMLYEAYSCVGYAY